MNELQQELFARQVGSIARQLDYPPTPDVAGSVMARLRVSRQPGAISRPVTWALTAILILAASLMLIPPARAAILDFIQIGIVRIFRAEPTPLPAPSGGRAPAAPRSCG